mmetsp:Transcript_6234/g.8913  ORF Transcript_6234/g.8913 Transcript_6234/m.8913 type:complete len:240 (-) Transcript_6234:1586-2305(-)
MTLMVPGFTTQWTANESEDLLLGLIRASPTIASPDSRSSRSTSSFFAFRKAGWAQARRVTRPERFLEPPSPASSSLVPPRLNRRAAKRASRSLLFSCSTCTAAFRSKCSSSAGKLSGRVHVVWFFRKSSIFRLKSTHIWSFFTSVMIAVTTAPMFTTSSAVSTWSSDKFRSGMKAGISPSNLTREPKSPFRTTLPITSFPGRKDWSDSPVNKRKSLSPLKGSIGFLGSSKGRRNSHLII